MIEIIWYPRDDRSNQARQRLTLAGQGPFGIGRSEHGDVVLSDPRVTREHAEFRIVGEEIRVRDLGSSNGTVLEGRAVGREPAVWPPGVPLEIGRFLLFANRLQARSRSAGAGAFPPESMDVPVVSVAQLTESGVPIEEVDYLALGAGLGSFTWANHLRVWGVPAKSIRAIGVEPLPYGKYKRLCLNSQIPLHERLRSNSISTPDNLWGFPGYASRETWKEFKKGKLSGLKYILQVFGEPTLQESYTPRAGDVFDSLDRESRRMGWQKIFVAGRILKLRKTDDGRFAVAYRVPVDAMDDARGQDRNRIVIGKFVHLALGYPASQYLDDLQNFKRNYPSEKNVVNAYEPHDDIYARLQQNGGIAMIRGRGIVASRIVQRLWEIRKAGSNVNVLHVMRSQIREGRQYDWARRHAAHDIEYQPFNWPKACWGGTLRRRLEKMPPDRRWQLMQQWGGTTTADRADWDQIIDEGKRAGWYRPFFGDVQEMELQDGRIVTVLAARHEMQETVKLATDCVIDCTGLIADLEENPILADLISTYQLKRNAASGSGPEQRVGGLSVSNDFEVTGLRNGKGRAYAAGVMTVNGPYAAVDSFLGLQYAALRSVDHLRKVRAKYVRSMGPLRSFRQWLRWCRGVAP